jgi:hypothetical protein
MTDSANKAIERCLELDKRYELMQFSMKDEPFGVLGILAPRLARALKLAMEALESVLNDETPLQISKALSQIEKVFE